VVLDTAPHDRSGLEPIREIKVRSPGARILVFSAHDDMQFGVRCLRVGADGFLSKREPTARLVEAVRKIGRGGKHLSLALAEALATSVGERRVTHPQEQLSTRELDVFLRIASGQGLTTIGHDLGLSVKTVGTYRSRILEKTGSHSNADLTRLALMYEMIGSTK
jgi:DNA-binding NarL/FixJ family response regulator